MHRRGQKITGYRVLVGKPEGKRPLGRPKIRWKDGIIIGVGILADWCGVDSAGSG
jgi:hypothetical protein